MKTPYEMNCTPKVRQENLTFGVFSYEIDKEKN